ncbi:hypothetical protein BD410DRAFT_681469, partial [Rickenella mellea]
SCKLTIKSYPGTAVILGSYVEKHSHPIGAENLKYIHVSEETRDWIAGELRNHVEPQHILKTLHGNIHSDGSILPEDYVPHRNDFITLREIRQIQKDIEAETVRLSREDGVSCIKWAEKLRESGDLLAFKALPVSWMIASNGQEETINYYLLLFRQNNPSTTPKYIMSDKDRGQMNAIQAKYPLSTLYLCWWHVLHAWQQHFSTSDWPEVWTLLRRWIRVTNAEEFENIWRTIRETAPPSMVQYLEDNWMNEVELWSAMYRRGRSIEAENVVPYYIQKHCRQAAGFDGPNLEQKRRSDMDSLGLQIPSTDITEVDESVRYLILSQSDQTRFYIINLTTFSCSCPSFTSISFCKHMAAIRHRFPE